MYVLLNLDIIEVPARNELRTLKHQNNAFSPASKNLDIICFIKGRVLLSGGEYPVCTAHAEYAVLCQAS